LIVANGKLAIPVNLIFKRDPIGAQLIEVGYQILDQVPIDFRIDDLIPPLGWPHRVGELRIF
jgi:hypothetical protein